MEAQAVGPTIRRASVSSCKDAPSLQRLVLEGVNATGRELGRGSYGTVEELDMEGLICAGKKLHDSLVERGNAGTGNVVRRFVEECSLISNLHHPNIVQSLGICFFPGSPLPVLVMEYLPYCLDDMLENKDCIIPFGIKLSILRDVAQGLTYLHGRSPPVIHRDLTAKNVLMNSALSAKIADLGVARIVNLRPGQLQATMTQAPGTQAYMAPESMEENPKYNTTLDLFSFGQLALYTIVNEFPLPTAPTKTDPRTPRKVIGLTEVERRQRHVDKLLAIVGGMEHLLAKLIVQCLDNDASQRPAAKAILGQLRALGEQGAEKYERMSRLELIQVAKAGMQGQWQNTAGEVEELKAHIAQLQTKNGKLDIEVQLHQSQSRWYNEQIQEFRSRLLEMQRLEVELKADLQLSQKRVKDLEASTAKQGVSTAHETVGRRKSSSNPPLPMLSPQHDSSDSAPQSSQSPVVSKAPTLLPSLSFSQADDVFELEGQRNMAPSNTLPSPSTPGGTESEFFTSRSSNAYVNVPVPLKRSPRPSPLPSPRRSPNPSPHHSPHVSPHHSPQHSPLPSPVHDSNEVQFYLKEPQYDRYAHRSKSFHTSADASGDLKGLKLKRCDSVPYDPNLVCFKCGERFRHGEIQLYRKHCSLCT